MRPTRAQVRNEALLFIVIAATAILVPLHLGYRPNGWTAALLTYYIGWRVFDHRRRRVVPVKDDQ